MAKRNTNDRNEIAVQRAKRKAEDMDHYVLPSGLVLTLKDFDPTFLQMVLGTVEHPELPTYEVKLASGRTERYPMDEKVVEQSPELKDEWEKYIIAQAAATTHELDLLARTLILDATVIDPDFHDVEWERRLKIVQAKPPADPEERWVMYVRPQMDTVELILDFVQKVMRRRGVPEELIEAAQGTFRTPVSGGQGEPGDLAESETDSGRVEREEAGPVAA